MTESAVRRLDEMVIDVLVRNIQPARSGARQLRRLGRSLPGELVDRIVGRILDSRPKDKPWQENRIHEPEFWLDALEIAKGAQSWGAMPHALSAHLRGQERLNVSTLLRLRGIGSLSLHGTAVSCEVLAIVPKLERLELLRLSDGGRGVGYGARERPAESTGELLGKCKRLRALDIKGIAISDDDVKFLRLLTSLELLRIALSRGFTEKGLVSLLRPPAAGAGLERARWIKVEGGSATRTHVDWSSRFAQGKVGPVVKRIDVGEKLWLSPAAGAAATGEGKIGSPTSRDARQWDWSVDWAALEQGALQDGARIRVTHCDSAVSLSGRIAPSSFSRVHSLLCTAQMGWGGGVPGSIARCTSSAPNAAKPAPCAPAGVLGLMAEASRRREFGRERVAPNRTATIKGRFGAVSLVTPAPKKARTAPPRAGFSFGFS